MESVFPVKPHSRAKKYVEAVDWLPARYRRVLQLRDGLLDLPPLSVVQIARRWGSTPAAVAEMERKARAMHVMRMAGGFSTG